MYIESCLSGHFSISNLVSWFLLVCFHLLTPPLSLCSLFTFSFSLTFTSIFSLALFYIVICTNMLAMSFTANVHFERTPEVWKLDSKVGSIQEKFWFVLKQTNWLKNIEENVIHVINKNSMTVWMTKSSSLCKLICHALSFFFYVTFQKSQSCFFLQKSCVNYDSTSFIFVLSVHLMFLLLI